LQTALGWQAYDRTGDPLTLGLLGLAEFFPALLLVIPAGHASDRYDRRLVVALASLLGTAVAVGFAVDAALGDTQTWPLYALAAAGGAAQSFASPSFNPLLAASVPAASLSRVIALSSLTWQSSSVTGPVIGGVLQGIGNAIPYLVAAVLTVTTAVLVLFVSREIGTAHVIEDELADATFSDALAGVRLIMANRALLGAISLDLAAVLFGGATALLPAFAQHVLHTSSTGYGVLRAAAGVGAVLVGLLLAARPLRRRVGPTLMLAVATFGALTVVFGLSRTYLVALLALAGLAGADMISVLIRGTLTPLLTPPALRGRVSAVERVFVGASNELGAFESGVAAALLGVAPAIVLGGLASMGIAVLWSWWFPSLRNVDRFEDVVPAELREPVASGAPHS
jgi:hypothetical protein